MSLRPFFDISKNITIRALVTMYPTPFQFQFAMWFNDNNRIFGCGLRVFVWWPCERSAGGDLSLGETILFRLVQPDTGPRTGGRGTLQEDPLFFFTTSCSISSSISSSYSSEVSAAKCFKRAPNNTTFRLERINRKSHCIQCYTDV